MLKYLSLGLVILAVVPSSLAWSEEPPTVEITIKDHRFTPNEIHIPSNTKIKLIVKNLDATPEEFESTELNREKVVTGGGIISLLVGPIPSGDYKFFGEFHPETAQGKIIVDDKKIAADKNS